MRKINEEGSIIRTLRRPSRDQTLPGETPLLPLLGSFSLLQQIFEINNFLKKKKKKMTLVQGVRGLVDHSALGPVGSTRWQKFRTELITRKPKRERGVTRVLQSIAPVTPFPHI